MPIPPDSWERVFASFHQLWGASARGQYDKRAWGAFGEWLRDHAHEHGYFSFASTPQTPPDSGPSCPK